MLTLCQIMLGQNEKNGSTFMGQMQSMGSGDVVSCFFFVTFKTFPSIMHLLAHSNGFCPRALESTCMASFLVSNKA